MNNIPCEVAKDLMPSYIDGLTSKVTNDLLEAHIAGCSECKETLETMREAPEVPQASEQREKAEIDFLKKNRRRNRLIVFGAFFSVLSLLLAFYIRYFVIGEVMYGAFNVYDIQVEGNRLSIQGEAKSNAYYKIKGFSEDEADGVVTFTARGSRKIFAGGTDEKLTFNAEYYYDTDITMVRMDGRILWHDGARISALASDIYETRHDYMGDMPANNRTANALNLSAHLGEYQNELESDDVPLTWIIQLANPVTSDERNAKEQRMRSFGYLLLAMTGNLDAVRFAYECDGASQSETITAADATAFFGQDIKNCMTSARLLDELLHKTDLATYSWYDSIRPSGSDALKFSLLNDTDTEFAYISFALYQGEALTQSGGAMNADESPIGKGETVWFDLGVSDVASGECHLEFILQTTDGKDHRVEEEILFPRASGTLQPLALTGNSEDGFHVSQ